MIILDFYMDVCHCSHTLSVTKVISHIYCSPLNTDLKFKIVKV
jgi:hypothetical protein